MQKRRFYRLYEISDVSTVTQGDLLEAVEQGQLSLLAKIDQQDLAYSYREHKEGYKVTLGDVFDYSGLILLSKAESKRAIKESKIELLSALVAQPELAENWRKISKVFPNANQDGWYVSNIKPLDFIPDKPFHAVGSLVEMPSGLKKAKKFVDEERKKEIEDRSYSDPFDFFEKAMSKIDERQLAPTKVKIDKDSLRFDLVSVHKVFGLDTNQNALQSPIIVNVGDVETHPIKDLIHKVLKAKPDADYQTIWNLIKKDNRTEPRQIDKDGVISEINNDEIAWFGKNDAVKVLKYITFRNYVTKARNKR
ncbi:hypothetical protein [Enterovibrio calviensis]|uniref:hypothetical protein n=1 Tax=Enterovibrio calviensis TaxID=91359 RepID=UPI0037368165